MMVLVRRYFSMLRWLSALVPILLMGTTPALAAPWSLHAASPPSPATFYRASRSSGLQSSSAAGRPAGDGRRVQLAFDTVITGTRSEAASLVSACRAERKAGDGYFWGYCQGYISSKLRRIPKEKFEQLEARWNRSRQPAFVIGADVMNDIIEVIRSGRFDDRNFSRFLNRFDRPVTAEDVLDYVINDILYLEDH
jgi:hypothetical protein